MYRIILTGGIASGKTEAANFFKALGVEVIDADDISKDLVGAGKPAFHQICSTFKENLLLENGELNRKALREKVFFNTNDREKLENILHPLIHERITQISEKSSSRYLIIVLPLFLKTKQIYKPERILFIDAPKEIRRIRLMKRDKISTEEINQIFNIQVNGSQYRQIADDILLNSGHLEILKKEVQLLHKKYIQLTKNYDN